MHLGVVPRASGRGVMLQGNMRGPPTPGGPTSTHRCGPRQAQGHRPSAGSHGSGERARAPRGLQSRTLVHDVRGMIELQLGLQRAVRTGRNSRATTLEYLQLILWFHNADKSHSCKYNILCKFSSLKDHPLMLL